MAMPAHRNGKIGLALLGAFFGGHAGRPQIHYQDFLGRWWTADDLDAWDAPAVQRLPSDGPRDLINPAA